MDFREVLEKRRAVNFFDPDRDVSAKQIEMLVNMAAKAPSSFNLQPWNLIILTEKEDKKRLRRLAMDQPRITEAPVVFIVLADRDGWKKGHYVLEKNFREMVKSAYLAEEQYGWFVGTYKKLYGESHEKQQAFACKNAGFFAMTLMFAAKELGLDTHPMDGFDHEAVKKEFNVPDNFWIPLLLAVGYFDDKKEMQPPKWRKSFDEIVIRF